MNIQSLDEHLEAIESGISQQEYLKDVISCFHDNCMQSFDMSLKSDPNVQDVLQIHTDLQRLIKQRNALSGHLCNIESSSKSQERMLQQLDKQLVEDMHLLEGSRNEFERLQQPNSIDETEQLKHMLEDLAKDLEIKLDALSAELISLEPITLGEDSSEISKACLEDSARVHTGISRNSLDSNHFRPHKPFDALLIEVEKNNEIMRDSAKVLSWIASNLTDPQAWWDSWLHRQMAEGSKRIQVWDLLRQDNNQQNIGEQIPSTKVCLPDSPASLPTYIKDHTLEIENEKPRNLNKVLQCPSNSPTKSILKPTSSAHEVAVKAARTSFNLKLNSTSTAPPMKVQFKSSLRPNKTNGPITAPSTPTHHSTMLNYVGSSLKRGAEPQVFRKTKPKTKSQESNKSASLITSAGLKPTFTPRVSSFISSRNLQRKRSPVKRILNKLHLRLGESRKDLYSDNYDFPQFSDNLGTPKSSRTGEIPSSISRYSCQSDSSSDSTLQPHLPKISDYMTIMREQTLGEQGQTRYAHKFYCADN